MGKQDFPPIPRRLANWWLEDILGSGYSGSIFRAKHIHTNQVVALKVQHRSHECPTNQYERHVYPVLQAAKGLPTYWAGGIDGDWDYIAIDLLGPSLDRLYCKAGGPGKPMDLNSVCCIAMQIIERLQLMHSRGILHRDIQLGNTVVGLKSNKETLYMIDFGFAKKYIDPYTRRHIPDSRAKRDFIGNYWFSSINVHCLGRVPTRRDDIEACALMLIHLLTPRGLRWTRDGVPKTSAAHARVKQLKRSATAQELCRGLPPQFEEFLRYSRRLRFSEQPDYGMWTEEFRDLKMSLGYGESDAFIWPPPQPKPLTRAASILPDLLHRPATIDRRALADILNNLARLNLDDKKRVNDKKTEACQPEKRTHGENQCNNDGVATKQIKVPPEPTKVLQFSNRTAPSADEQPPPSYSKTESKASRIINLVERVANSKNNTSLSVLVCEFITALKCNSSRTLTREASLFLNALCKQLGDPSGLVLTSPTASRTEPREPAYVKLGVVARLRVEVARATSNQLLATMVEDFGKVTNKSTGRTITKDGFAFLEGLAEKLIQQ